MKSNDTISEDYEFIGISEDPGWAIRLLTSKWKNVIVHYEDIRLTSEDGTPKDIFKDDDDIKLSFTYNILNSGILPENNNTDKMGEKLGKILMHAIMQGLEDGTAVLNERDLKQDNTSIAIN